MFDAIATIQLSEKAWESVPALCVFGSLNLWLVLAFLKHLTARATEEREAQQAQSKACEDRIEKIVERMNGAVERNTHALERSSEVTEGVRELLRSQAPPSP